MSSERELVTKIDALLRRRYGNTAVGAQRQLFTSFDADGDGRISAAELEALLKAADVGNTFTRGAWVRGIMKKMDTDGDEGITWAEYEGAIRAARQRS